MTKHIVDVPAGNPVLGASIGAFDEWRYLPAVRAGGLLFVAGVVGVRPDGSIPESVEEQADLAFRRTAEILRLEGLGFGDLIEMVSYHVKLADMLSASNAVKDRHIVRPFPTWTVLGIEALGLPELKLEIRSVAALRS